MSSVYDNVELIQPLKVPPCDTFTVTVTDSYILYSQELISKDISQQINVSKTEI